GSHMRHFICMLTIIFLSGCISASKLPYDLRYVMPGKDEIGVSIITATIIDDKVPLFDHDSTYVYAIDGKKVMLDKKQWDQPVFIRPGMRDVVLGFKKGTYVLFAKVQL